MKKLSEFVTQHITDDIARLLLNKDKYPEIDMNLAVNCIESRRKLKGKVQEWYDDPDLIFPLKLSAEQCSSSGTATYKAILAERIATDGTSGYKWKIADLTGGLGVDSWFFSKRASQVLYNEMQQPLCMAAEHNFIALKADNIIISNHMVSSDPDECSEAVSPAQLLEAFKPDIVYMDPARRSSDGKKVFLIEDCSPDVLKLKEEIFRHSRHILLKLSPMADISMACGRLGKECREVHIVAYGGECKELLIWMDREWDAGYTITAVEMLDDDSIAQFIFSNDEERSAKVMKAEKIIPESYLFEPGKAFMKAGAFNLIGNRFGIRKIGTSTHYYIDDGICSSPDLRKFGKTFRILRCEPLDKRSIKKAGKDYPESDVTARNIPMDTDTLRKRLGVSSGNRIHIFGLHSDIEGNLLIVTERI